MAWHFHHLMNRHLQRLGPRAGVFHGLHKDVHSRTCALLWIPSISPDAHKTPHQIRLQSDLRSPVPANYRGHKAEVTLPVSKANLSVNERQRQILGERSAEAEQLERDIMAGQVNATQYLREQMARGTATSEQVRVCLHCELNLLRKIPRRARSEKLSARKDPFARIVLDLLWRDQSLWIPLCIYDQQAGVALCYFAIAEGHLDLLTRWLNVDIDVGSLDENLRGWNAWPFTAILNAFFLHDTESSASRALQYFFDTLDTKDALRRQHRAKVEAGAPPGTPLLATISLSPAVRTLVKELTGGNYHNTDKTLYGHFCRFFSGYRSSLIGPPIVKEFDEAVLATKHPTQSRPDELLNFMRKQRTTTRRRRTSQSSSSRFQ